MRRLLTAIALAGSMSFVLVGAQSASASSSPAEGVFESCTLSSELSTCLQRLGVMRQGGLKVVVIPASGAPLTDLAQYAAAAHSDGMSVMWELDDGTTDWWSDPASSTVMSGYYPMFAAACGCRDNNQLLAYMVKWLGGLGGTYGYYAADDGMLSPGDDRQMTAYVQAIKAQDPSHTVMIGSADETQTKDYQHIADVMGNEIYPVTNGSVDWSGVAQEASDDQRNANQAGKQSAFILQAFTWGDNVSDGQAIGACTANDTRASCYAMLNYPTASQQLKLRNEILTHADPKLILWWSFFGTAGDVTGDTSSIFPTGNNAASRWQGLAAAIHAPAPLVGRAQIARKDLKVVHNSAIAAGSGGSIASSSSPSGGTSAPGATSTGATVSYSDTAAAQTTLAVLRAVPGIRSPHGCDAAAGRLPGGKDRRCTSFASVGTFTHRDRAGRNSFHFTGRLNGSKLLVGKYRLVAFGTVTRLRGTSAATTFQIVA
jgi:hypothetical protein